MQESTTINLELSRLVTVGSMFRPTSRDTHTADLLLNGRLLLSPHPEQEIQKIIDWDADPLSDRNWRAQLNMLRWLDPLRREELQGNELAGVRWLEITEQWIRRNIDPATAVDSAWMDMVDGIRARSLIAGLDLVNRLAPDKLPFYESALVAHGEWLNCSDNHGHSNHLLHQLEALVAIGLVLGRSDWKESGVSGAMKLFRDQYDDEGVNAEGAVGYHLNNYKWWREAQQILFLGTKSQTDPFELLDRTGEELAHATQPDGTLTPIGNTGIVRPIDRGNAPLEFVTSSGARGKAPDDLFAIYSSGYIYGRSGWGEHERPMSEETFFSLLFGRNDRVHGHIDSGSLTYFAGGAPLLVDPGKYSYDGGAERSHFNRRDAHNVVVVDGRFHDRRIPVTLSRQTVTSEYADFILDDRGYKDVNIERRVIYSVEGEFLVVLDGVDSEREVTAHQSWQLSPEVHADVDGYQINLSLNGKHAVLATFGIPPSVTVHHGETEPLAGWVATGWKVREPASQVRVERTGTKFRFVSVISAGYRDHVPVVTNVSGLPKGILGFDVTTGRSELRMLILRDEVLTGPIGWLPNFDLSAAEGDESEANAPQSREALVSLIKDAKQSAWACTDSHERVRIAQELRESLDSTSFAGGDLIAQVAVADLIGADSESEVEPTSAGRRGLVSWPNGKKLEPVGGLPVVSYRGVPDAITAPEDPVLLTFDLGELVLPVAVAPDPGSILTVLFHGAIDRSRFQLPFFQRYRFQRTLQSGPTVAISDPTLDLHQGLRLGWYLGSDGIDLPPVLGSVVARLRDALGVERVVLQGNSGGGFAAIASATYVDDTTVVAFDPQTDLRRYIKRFYLQAIEAATGLSNDVIEEILPESRLSVLSRMLLENRFPRIVGVSNRGDQIHRGTHLQPLQEFMSTHAPDRFSMIDLDLGPGHNSPSNDEFAEVMRKVYNS